MGGIKHALALALGALFSTGVFFGVESWTVASTTPRLSQVEPLDDDVRRQLERVGITYLTQLRGPGSARWWQVLSAHLDAPAQERLGRLTDLYLHEGIGTEFGNALAKAGLYSIEDLCRYSCSELSQRLSAASAPDGRLPTLAQIRVWRRRAACE